MHTKKTDITYVFGFGRSNLISSNENFADEFFYGYFNFLNNKNVNFIEFKELKGKNLIYFISKIFRKFSKLSFFFENICSIKNFKILWNTNNIIATNDRIGISLLPFLIIYKLFKINKVTIITMGLLAKETNNILSHILQRFLLTIFFYFGTNFIFLSKGEYIQAQMSYEKFKQKFHFVPFCIDTDFWQTEEGKKKELNKIIFIGNDGRRDYDLAVKIAKELPEYNFIFITSNLKKLDLQSSNIELIKGSWNKRLLTDEELKEYYEESVISIIPIRNTYQPSGQSVALQSMSMNVPVLITDTIGFWDKSMFKHEQNIFFVDDNNLKTWTNEIKKRLADINKLNLVTQNANNTVKKFYNSKLFYNSLNEIIFDL